MAEQATDHRRAIADRNIEAILDATERLLARGEQATISAVADEAGVSWPAVYFHFPDREQLLAGVVRRAVDRWIEATERVEPQRGPAVEALGRLIEVGWQEISRSSHIAHVASTELGPRPCATLTRRACSTCARSSGAAAATAASAPTYPSSGS